MPLGKPSFVKKKIFCEMISLTGGGLTDFIPLFYFSKHPPNTLQTPCNTLKTPINTLQTTFKIIFFFDQKMVEKKNKQGLHKRGTGGGGHHFMKWFHKKSFFSQLRASLIILFFLSLFSHLHRIKAIHIHHIHPPLYAYVNVIYPFQLNKKE